MEGLEVVVWLAVLIGLLVSIRRDRRRTPERVGTDAFSMQRPSIL
jgi:hypothetical protein